MRKAVHKEVAAGEKLDFFWTLSCSITKTIAWFFSGPCFNNPKLSLLKMGWGGAGGNLMNIANQYLCTFVATP